MTGEVRTWLERHAGLEPALLDDATIARLVTERRRETGVRDERGYLERLRSSADEQERLIARVAVPESWLFRYPRSYELLAEHLATLRSSPAAPTTLRLLSAACAMGAEPCSMAITARHAGWPADRVRIDAVDRDPAQIAAARAGRLARGTVRGDAPAWAAARLRETDDGVPIADDLAAMINPQRADLLAPSVPGVEPPYHVIFCRNLLIYLNGNARRALVTRLTEWLVRSGLLFLGHADPLDLFGQEFAPVRAPHTFCLRRETPPPAVRHAPPIRPAGPGRRRPAPSSAPTPRPTTSGARAPRTDAASPTLADARRLADRGRLDDALAATKSVLVTHGPHVEALSLLGNVQLALGRLEDARGSFRKAIYLDPEHGSSLLQLALISERLAETEQAAALRRRAIHAHRKQLDAKEDRRDR